MVVLYFFIVIVATLLPAAIWLFFFLREGERPEPKRLVFYTFAIGGLITLPTLLVQVFAHVTFTQFIYLGDTFLIVVLASIEEVFKFLAAYFSVGKRRELEKPIDHMIYMVVAALGFATIENLFIVGDKLSFFGPGPVQDVLATLSLRFVGATFLHTLSSALLGFYWAKGRFRGEMSKRIVEGLILATLMHSLFNYLVIKFQNNYLLYPSFFLLVVGFFVLNDFEELKIDSGAEVEKDQLPKTPEGLV